MIQSYHDHDVVVISMKDQFKLVGTEITRAEEIYKDPVKLGYLMHRLVEEREITNRLFKDILTRLDMIEKRLEGERKGGGDPPLLSEIEEKILTFVGEKGRVNADDVKEAFSYSQQNGASARLNKLYESGLLNKGRAGKKVYYWKKKK